MSMVVGVRFKNAGKLYYFNPGNMWPVAGDPVIVETMRGIEYAQCVMGVQKVNEEDITASLKQVVRIATQEDTLQHQSNLEVFRRFPTCFNQNGERTKPFTQSNKNFRCLRQINVLLKI